MLNRPLVRQDGIEQLRKLLDAISDETYKLLRYLDEEYFEDIDDDPRFDRVTSLLSLHAVLQSDPLDPHIPRFFAELDKEKGGVKDTGRKPSRR